MADITITINDVDLADVRDTLCIRWGYDAGSGLTKVQFLKQRVAQWIKDEYVIHKGELAVITNIDDVRFNARQTASSVDIV